MPTSFDIPQACSLARRAAQALLDDLLPLTGAEGLARVSS